jgi:tetratricopeptide (TPR) repeat protein
VPARLLLQDLLRDRDGRESVLRRARRAVEADPEDRVARLLLVRLDPDPGERLVKYRELAAAEPGDAWARLGVADAAVDVSHRAGAALAEAERSGTVADRERLSALRRERDGRLEEAREAVDRAIAIAPRLVPAIRRRGDVLGEIADVEDDPAARGRLLDARRAAYDRALALDPEDVPSLVARAEIHRRRNDYVEAQRDLARALAVRPSDPDLHQNLGVVAYEMGQLSLAERSFRRAVELEPRSPELLRNLGDTLAAREDLGEAERVYERGLALTPESPELLERLGNLNLRRDRNERALGYYRRYLAAGGPDRERVEAMIRLAGGEP